MTNMTHFSQMIHFFLFNMTLRNIAIVGFHCDKYLGELRRYITL